MTFKPPILVIFCLIGAITASFINPYPRFRTHFDDGDPGEPLFLTPFIESGKIVEGQKAARVDHPEMSQIAPEAYAGYLTVNASCNSNMFFWFFRAKIQPDKAPLVLWLQGGPGATSLFGLFTELGPFYVTETKKLKPRKYSWHLQHNLLFIDNPVGTGFSFTDHDECYSTNEVQVGANLYETLRQFLLLFPELQTVPFFVTGESYAGKYVPAIAHTIAQRNDDAKLKINLAGLAIGNGLCDPIHQLNYGDYLYQLGLVDRHGAAAFHEWEAKGAELIKKRDFESAFHVFDQLIDGDVDNASLFRNLTGFTFYYNYLHSKEPADYMGEFVQRSEVRHGIHVGNKTFHTWEGEENLVEKHLVADIMDTVAPWVSSLLAHYPVVIYNGQLDIIVAYPLTENFLSKLSFTNSTEYKTAPRRIWRVDGEIAGYVKEAGNLHEVMVRNAGHMVPSDQPKWALDLLLHLTQGKKFH